VKPAVGAGSIDAGNVWGAVIAMIAACIAAFAYLRWTTGLYAEENLDVEPLVVPWASRVVIFLAVAYALVFGIDPSLLTSITSHATFLFQP
jgi:NADH:ubiquinone oxidoreductase subunit 2 (subunit N)